MSHLSSIFQLFRFLPFLSSFVTVTTHEHEPVNEPLNATKREVEGERISVWSKLDKGIKLSHKDML